MQHYHGMPVESNGERLGTVVGVDNDPATGATRLIVEGDAGTRYTLASEMFTVRDDTVYVIDAASMIDADRAQHSLQDNTTVDRMEVAPHEEVRIPVLREEAVVGIQQVERGGVRVHKYVNERTETVEQPVVQEHVDVERITIGRVIEDETVPQAREEGDTLIIPVIEEILVVEKRQVLKEEVRITKRRREEVEHVEVVLREEDVQIEQIGDDRDTPPAAGENARL